ncbi:MAG TPA: DinB family protein [Candidatus Dormibacteraeota bacterium]|nr:DinB family protein [Candidatus Dormibacteraeota bacterium]
MRTIYSRRATAVAEQFVTSTEFLAGILEGLSDEEWRAPVPSDARTVGVLARHLADTPAVFIEIARSVSAGGKLPTWDAVNEWNAQAAKTHADCRQAETIQALREAAKASVEAISQFTDEQLDVTTQNAAGQTRSVTDLLHHFTVEHTLQHTSDIERALIDAKEPAAIHQTSSTSGTPSPTHPNGKGRKGMLRLVVTGETDEGKSVFVSDRKVDPVTVAAMPNTEFYRLWGSDDSVQLPSSGNVPSFRTLFPPATGFRFAVMTLGPDQTTMPPDFDAEAAMAEMQEKLPGAAEWMDFQHPGMHRTDTVDVVVVLSGEIWLELDNGKEAHLKAGDCVVQNGTRHAWRNKSSAPCTFAGTLIGAERRS